MALHRALLEWLILGTPLALWSSGCLHSTIIPPQGTCRGPYDRRNIAAAILLPRGNTSLIPCMPYNGTPTPPNLGTLPALNSPHLSPLAKEERELIPTKDQQGTPEGTTPPTEAAHPPSTAHQSRPTGGTLLFRPLSIRDLLRRASTAKRAQTARTRTNARLY